MITWDARWQGHFGISRYGREIRSRLDRPLIDLSGGGRPATLRGTIGLGLTLNRRRPRLHVSPGFNAAPLYAGKQLLTVHDLIHFHEASESSRAKTAYYNRVVRPAIARCGSVVTVSEYSRRAVIEWSGLSASAVTVVPNGVSTAFRERSSGGDSLPALDDFGRPFVLFVGTSKPHKRFPQLVDAMSVLRRAHAGVGLVTVGLDSAYVAALARRADLPPDHCLALNALTDSQLAETYRKALCLAVPSSREGFGLMAAEAMACGTRTAYTCDAVAEVVGPTGARATDDTVEAFATALGRCLEEPVDEGSLKSRADRFTWDRSARLFDEVLASASAM